MSGLPLTTGDADRGHLHRALGLAVMLALPAAALAACAPAAQRKPAALASPTPAVVITHGTRGEVTRQARPAAVISRFRAADGSVITLARFTGPVRYRLHSGSADPGAAALRVVRAGPDIAAPERRRLIAAFNSGFLLSAGAGGYEQEGHIIKPLRAGLASLVIDTSGTARIGVWGAGGPATGESVFSVRQNLRLLVARGHPGRAASDWAVWGATFGGGERVARSAIGQNAAGEIIYAGSMSATPADLAAALVHAGARTAMELDINPEWVQLDVARAAGRRLRAAIPGQIRPAGQYLTGWTRDFITVLG